MVKGEEPASGFTLGRVPALRDGLNPFGHRVYLMPVAPPLQKSVVLAHSYPQAPVVPSRLVTEPDSQSVTPGLHTVTPLLGSCRQLDGEPASLMEPRHYPVEAVCRKCGQPIRTERYYSPVWDHIERFTMTGPAA